MKSHKPHQPPEAHAHSHTHTHEHRHGDLVHTHPHTHEHTHAGGHKGRVSLEHAHLGTPPEHEHAHTESVEEVHENAH